MENKERYLYQKLLLQSVAEFFLKYINKINF